MRIKHAELFAGIGGFSLAARWAGWENVFMVEKDEWCRSKLKKNFPKTALYGDIKEFNGKKYKGAIDILSGGFPCQPFSLSGQHKGKSDDRYLWPEMFRVFKEIRPRFFLAENVPGIINMALDKVLADLEGEGYTCWPPLIIPACAVGTDHRRDRVWIIAHITGNRWKAFLHGYKEISFEPDRASDKCYSHITVAEQFKKRYAQPLLFNSKDGLPETMDIIKTLEAMGNAIVPQIAYTIYQFINVILKY